MRAAFALALFAAALAQALAAGATPPPADPGQIAAPAAASADASQIPVAPAAATTSQQIAPAQPTAAAPQPLSSVRQGRDPALPRVAGRDRCDPASAGVPADCAHILDRQAGDFSDGSQPAGDPSVQPDQPASGLVDDVVNGGTGTVVPLPPK